MSEWQPTERVAVCCLPGGACYEAGLSDVQHMAESTPDRIWIWFADNGNIRKWSHEPFAEGTIYARAPLLQE